MSSTFKVKNFEKFQHYKDRSPPWIKLYNDVLEDYAFGSLPDASKAHLLAIWLLASRTGNELPFDPDWIGKRINATEPVDLILLVEAGFIVLDQPLQQAEQDASEMLQTPEHDARPETETEQRESRAEREAEQSRGGAAAPPPAAEPERPKPPPLAEQSSESADLELPSFLNRGTKGTRLPPDWQPASSLIDWAATNVPGLDWRRETEQFRDYWIAKAGKDATKLDWGATWRKWMRTAHERLPSASATRRPAATTAGPDWRRRLEAFRSGGAWLPGWGAKPGDEFCIVPADLLAEYGYGRAA